MRVISQFDVEKRTKEIFFGSKSSRDWQVVWDKDTVCTRRMVSVSFSELFSRHVITLLIVPLLQFCYSIASIHALLFFKQPLITQSYLPCRGNTSLYLSATVLLLHRVAKHSDSWLRSPLNKLKGKCKVKEKRDAIFSH